MEQTSNLKLPFIMPSQAQKHVTHNEALQSLDALVQLAVLDRHLAAPPASPADGDRYIVAAMATGAWNGKTGQIAIWQDGAWEFYAPVSGWLAWVADEQRLFILSGGVWVDALAQGLNPATMVGINTTADTTDRLSVKSPAVLFDNEGTDQRVKINKGAPGDTASMLFQTAYSGRAEFGLAGDDDWHIKVSPDGSAWKEALKVNRIDGRVLLPAGLPLTDPDQAVARRHIRETLAANRTYYVRTDGADANNGLSNTSAGAFLTIQKAWNTIVAVDLNGFTATIKLGNTGTFTAGLAATVSPVGGDVIIEGDTTTPANTVLSTATNAINIACAANVTTRHFKVQATSGYALLTSHPAARITIDNGMNFGPCSGGSHMGALPGLFKLTSKSYAISGGAVCHMAANLGGFFDFVSPIVTLTGTPAFSYVFAYADTNAAISCFGATFTGVATGSRYASVLNGVIKTSGGGAAYFPGSAVGSTASGGQYS